MIPVSHIFASLGLSYLVFKMGMTASHLLGARGCGEVRSPLFPELPSCGAARQQRALVQKAAGGPIQEGADR